MVLICCWSVRILISIGLITATANAINNNEIATHWPRRYLASLDPHRSDSVKAFQEHLHELGVQHRILYDLTHQVPDVFYGLSIELMKEEDLQFLEESVHVEKISPLYTIRPSNTLDQKIIREPLNMTHGFPPHLQTRVSELHRMGIYGQGVKLALIDSGVDCTHPAIGNGFGPGFKVAFGRSFVKDDGHEAHSVRSSYNMLEIRSKKDEPRNPCTPCSTHGTHVAGIVAAADAGYGFVGVAPNVTLGMYRVFGCGDDVGTTNDMLLAAVLQAHKDGADIISASIGGPGGWGESDELSRVVNKLVQDKGAIILVAAGNEGSEGVFYGDDPASQKNVISVGSVDVDSVVSGHFKASTGKMLTLFRTTTLNLSGEYPIYITANSTDDPSDACEELPKQTPNLSKYVVLIKRGSCLFSLKAKHAVAKGAKNILFYMNSTQTITLSNTLSNASIAPISFEDGKYIFDQVKKNSTTFKVSFPKTNHFYIKSPKGGLPSDFSQYGPSFDFESPQPALSGIGGNVVSLFPVAQGSYASLSGTSMATPQLAGITALILSTRGKRFNGLTLRSRLATTARPLNIKEMSGLDTIVHQGGGLVDAFCAVWTNTSISTATLALKDSNSFRSNQEFTIYNNGTNTINYVLTHRPARTALTFSSDSQYGRPDVTSKFLNDSATTEINPEKFSLQPGSSRIVKINFTPPSHLNPHFLPIYSGYIVMTTDMECESHNVPYYGVLGSLREQPIIDRGLNENKTANYPYLTYKKNKSLPNVTNVAPLNTSFVWDLRQHNTTILHYRTLFGSPLWRADVIAGHAILSNKTSKSDFKQSFRGVKLIGLIPNGDGTAVSRSAADDTFALNWNATIVPKGKKRPSFLPNGSYKILLRALHVSGHKEQDGDYDYWVSPTFKLKNSPAHSPKK